MLATILFGIALIVLGGIFMLRHRAVWIQAQIDMPPSDENTDHPDRSFAANQYRRRMQISAMVAIVGLAMVASPLADGQDWMMFYWGVVVLIVVWITILAMLDALNTKVHFGQIDRHLQAERSVLEAQLRRAIAEEEASVKHEGNGPP